MSAGKIVVCDQCGWWWKITIGPYGRRRWLVGRRRRKMLFQGPFWPGLTGMPLTYTWDELAEQYGDCVVSLRRAGGLLPYSTGGE
jgi:hypothetical protein